MGVLIDGKWSDGELPQETTDTGQFKRVDSSFRDRITADGSSGFKAEPGRYHLYVAHGCPWAHRTLIYRALKKLDGLISVAYSIPGLKQQGWTFENNPAFPDCIAGYRERLPLHARGLYRDQEGLHRQGHGADACGTRRPRRSSTTSSSEIIRMLNTEFNAITGDRTDYYPQALRAEIDAVNERVYHNVNNGVYRAGFAKSQAAYEEAYDGLFATLDWLEERLSRQRYLAGNQITEADWRLFPTLVRFDVAYFSIFKCNKKRIADYPNLENYMRELYQVPGVAGTVTPRYYVINYYSIPKVNPTLIIPKGTPVDFGFTARSRAAGGLETMIPRYSRPEMAAIWSPETRFRIWFEIEAHAADAMAKLGIVPKAAAKKIWDKGGKATFDVARIDEIERETKHDVIAFLTHLAEIVGPEARFVHSGMTSSDVLDTCFNVQLVRAADILVADVDRLLAALKKRAFEHKKTPTIGRSHGIHAEPTTFGVKLAVAYAEFSRAKRAADCRAEGGRDLRHLRRGRHICADRPAGRGACRQGHGSCRRAGIDPDHPTRPPRHVLCDIGRGRVVDGTAGDRNPPSAAHRSAGSRGVLLRGPEGLVGHAAQAQPGADREHHGPRPHGALLRAAGDGERRAVA